MEPAYVEGLDERTPAELRAMRDDCRAEEARLSYHRRLLQGELDIARAEAARRGTGDGAGLIEALPRILADEPGGPARDARSAALYKPGDSRREEDGVLVGDLSRLPDLSDDELMTLVVDLTDAERDASLLRAKVLSRLDLLQAELVARYRTGGVALDEILGDPGAPAAQRGV